MSFTGDMAIPVPVHFDGHNINIITEVTEFTNSSLPKPKDRTSLYKTELCREWTQSGWCYYGKRCSFAHGLQELRPVFRSKKWRTKRCRNWHTQGYCPYEHRCQFLHDQAAPRRIQDYSQSESGDVDGASGGVTPGEGGSPNRQMQQAAAARGVEQGGPAMYYHYKVEANSDEDDDSSDSSSSTSEEDPSEISHHKGDSTSVELDAGITRSPNSSVDSENRNVISAGAAGAEIKLSSDAAPFLPANPPPIIGALQPKDTNVATAAGATVNTATQHAIVKPGPNTAGETKTQQSTDAEVKEQDEDAKTNGVSGAAPTANVPSTSISGATASAVNVNTTVSDTGVSPAAVEHGALSPSSQKSPSAEAGAPVPIHERPTVVTKKKSGKEKRKKDKKKKRRKRDREPVITPINPVQGQPPFLNAVAAQQTAAQSALAAQVAAGQATAAQALLRQAVTNPTDFGLLYGLDTGFTSPRAAQDYLQSLGIPPVHPSDLEYYSAQAAAVSAAHAAHAAAAALQAASGMTAPAPLTQQSSTGSTGFGPLDPRAFLSASNLGDFTQNPSTPMQSASPRLDDLFQFPLPTPSPPPMIPGVNLQSMTNPNTSELFASFAAPPTPNTMNLLTSITGGVGSAANQAMHSGTHSHSHSPAVPMSATSPSAPTGSARNTSPQAGAPLMSHHHSTSTAGATHSVGNMNQVSSVPQQSLGGIAGASSTGFNPVLGGLPNTTAAALGSINNLMSSPQPQDFPMGLGANMFANIDSNAIMDFLAADPNTAALNASLMGLDLRSGMLPLSSTPGPDMLSTLSQHANTGVPQQHLTATTTTPGLNTLQTMNAMTSNRNLSSSPPAMLGANNSNSNLATNRVTAPVPAVNTLPYKQ